MKLKVHLVNLGNGAKSRLHVLNGHLKAFQIEHRTHKKVPGLPIRMMIRVDDVASEIMDKA